LIGGWDDGDHHKDSVVVVAVAVAMVVVGCCHQY
jgi:hypothetical protein